MITRRRGVHRVVRSRRAVKASLVLPPSFVGDWIHAPRSVREAVALLLHKMNTHRPEARHK